jgi:hypothetical protein
VQVHHEAEFAEQTGHVDIDASDLRNIADDLETMLAAQPNGAAFVVGARVRWSSQGRGTLATKAGIIERVIAPGETPSSREVREHGASRDHESYLVRGDNGRLYWPRVVTLEVLP